MDNELAPRTWTRIDEIADGYLDGVAQLSPITATSIGVPGFDAQLDDFSPDGYAAQEELRQKTLSQLRTANPENDNDAVTLAALTERCSLGSEMHERGFDLADLNTIASPLQSVRDVFDLMPTTSDEDWGVMALRLRQVPEALRGWLESLRQAADAGQVAAVRQVKGCIAQCTQFISEDGSLAHLKQLSTSDAGIDDDALREDFRAALGVAASAFSSASQALATDILPHAPSKDGVGREAYSLYSRTFLGMDIDLAETYAWGQEELARITGEMRSVAQQIAPGESVKSAMVALDADPRYRLEGVDALQGWMQDRADEAIAELAGTHFDIPDPVRRIECMIASSNSGGIYYTGPNEDFSRPGRMWWSVPTGIDTFGTWRELTTVYHEGVPGHHLQIGQTIYRSSLLNRWRRMGSWTSGHGEGWALYAERLMDELGYLSDPGMRLGMLDGQSFRAARVVLDIGVHCGFEAPAEVGGGEWSYDKARAFLAAHADLTDAALTYELNRYFGWPGQAPSYKVGERVWMQLRAEVEGREGANFDLKEFHTRALNIGGVGLDVLRNAVLGQ